MQKQFATDMDDVNNNTEQYIQVLLTDRGPCLTSTDKLDRKCVSRHGQALLTQDFVEHTLRLAVLKSGMILPIVNQLKFEFADCGNSLATMLPLRSTDW